MAPTTKPNFTPELTLVPAKIYRGKDIITDVLKFCGNYVVISGGFARWCVSPADNPAPYGDIDVFARDAYDKDVINERLGRLRVIYVNNNAATYEYFTQNKKYHLQFIYPQLNNNFQTYGTDVQLGKNFDFTICQVFIRNTDSALVSKLFVRDELDKKLRVHSSYTPLTTMHRVIKYSKMGYKISSKEMLKILYMWDNYPSKNKSKLFDKFSINNPEETVIDDIEGEGIY